jgi:hypothetical protein
VEYSELSFGNGLSLSLQTRNRPSQQITGMKTRKPTCLCLGFFEHRIYTLPFLLTTLHPSHMTLTEDRTFIPRASIGFCVEWMWVCGCRWTRFTGSWIVGWRMRARRGRVDCRSARSMVIGVGGRSGQEVIGG